MKTALLFGLLNCCTSVEAGEFAPTFNTTTPFSQGWMEDFSSGEVNCAGPAEYPYEWRPAGYGSNINVLLLAWINARTKGNSDLSVIVRKDALFARTKCVVASNGVETRGGWPCIFAEMPHLCAFDSDRDWANYNQQQGLIKSKHFSASRRKTVEGVRAEMQTVYPVLPEPSTDEFMDILARLYDYMHSHVQPWFKADVEAILDEPDIAAVREGKYVGMHIRRTDKINDGVTLTPTEEYFEDAAEYLAGAPGGLTATDISGLWLSTDDGAVFDEVKTLAPKYFPNIKPEAIVFVTGRVPVRPMVPGRFDEGASDRNTYEAIVLLRLELQMLAGAEVFSGTFSSNLGRIVCLMRHTLNKPKESAISADDPAWFPGRHN